MRYVPSYLFDFDFPTAPSLTLYDVAGASIYLYKYPPSCRHMSYPPYSPLPSQYAHPALDGVDASYARLQTAVLKRQQLASHCFQAWGRAFWSLSGPFLEAAIH